MDTIKAFTASCTLPNIRRNTIGNNEHIRCYRGFTNAIDILMTMINLPHKRLQ